MCTHKVAQQLSRAVNPRPDDRCRALLNVEADAAKYYIRISHCKSSDELGSDFRYSQH